MGVMKSEYRLKRTDEANNFKRIKCYGKQISEVSRGKISKKWDAPENCRLGEAMNRELVSNKNQKMQHVFKLAPTRENDFKYGKNI